MKQEQHDWYSVRCLFRHAGCDGMAKRNLYEERITIWRAPSFDAAIEMAEREAERYAEDAHAKYLGLAQAYHAFPKRFTSGSEVFSLMRESDRCPKEYLDTFFDSGDERQGCLPSEQTDPGARG